MSHSLTLVEGVITDKGVWHLLYSQVFIMQGEYWQNNECQALSTGDHPIMNKLTRSTVRLGGTVLLMDKFV